jgi:hypothetical protein
MSSYIGRYHRVRGLGLDGYSPPYVLDRKHVTLVPYVNDEWWQHPSGAWVPTLAGGIGTSRFCRPRLGFPWLLPGGSGASVNTLALDSAYTAGSAGDAFGTRIILTSTLTLNNIYFYLNAFTGTPANVNDLNWEIRTTTGNVPDTTAPGLVASGTKDPSSATGWINISGLSQSLTSNTIYWIIVADADGNATDFATVGTQGLFGPYQYVENYWDLSLATTANGFSSQSTPISSGLLVCVFDGGITHGWPYTGTATSANTTNRRGLYIDGLTEASGYWGAISFSAGSANFSGVELLAAATIPGGTPINTASIFTLDQAGVRNGAVLSSPYTLEKSTPYRFVFTYSAAATHPGKVNIGTGADANLRACRIGRGLWYYTESSGTTNWSNDDINALPRMVVLVDDQVATGGGLFSHPGMAGRIGG